MAQIKKRTKKKIRKELSEASSKLGVGGVVAILVALAVSIVGGVATEKLVTKNDCFALVGEKEYVIEVGDQNSSYTYSEEGFKVISFGKDMSDKVTVTTNMTRNDNGTYSIDTSEEGDYYIMYTVDSLKYGKIKRVRTFTVGASNE